MLYEMRANSNMDGYSTFVRADIIVTMDSDWQVKTLTTDCEYKVPLFGGIKCKEDITETFTQIGYNDDLPEKEFLNNFSMRKSKIRRRAARRFKRLDEKF